MSLLAASWHGQVSVIPASYLEKLNQEIHLQTSFTIDQFSPLPWARAVTIPTFLYQVRDDLYTRPSDIQAMYDNIPIAEKNYSGSRAQPGDGTVMLTSNAIPSRCWNGSTAS